MNETVGAKGGHNDQKRVLRIKIAAKKQLERHQEEAAIRRSDAEAKSKQRYVLIRSLPLFIASGVVNSFTSLPKKNLNRKRIRLIVAENNEKVVEVKNNEGREKVTIEVLPPTNEVHTEKQIKVGKNDKVEVLTTKKKKKKKKAATSEPVEEPVAEQIEEKAEEQLEEPVEVLDKTEETNNPVAEDKKTEVLNKLEKYEDKIKEDRYQLKNTLIVYNTIVNDKNNQLISEESAIFFDNVNRIINKINELERIIKYGDIKEDNTYIDELLDDQNNFYTSIDKKLNEIETRINSLTKKIDERKRAYRLSEEQVDSLKENYYQFEKWNEYFQVYQLEQEKLLQETKEKVAHATNIEERIRIEIESTNKQTRALLNLTAVSMLLPGNRAAKSIALATTSTIFFINSLLKPPITTEKYENIEVMDYRAEIEKSVESIEETSIMLENTTNQLDETLKQMKTSWHELDSNPEAIQVFVTLDRMKDSMQEKVFEMAKLKEENMKQIDSNTKQVLSR